MKNTDGNICLRCGRSCCLLVGNLACWTGSFACRFREIALNNQLEQKRPRAKIMRCCPERHFFSKRQTFCACRKVQASSVTFYTSTKACPHGTLSAIYNFRCSLDIVGDMPGPELKRHFSAEILLWSSAISNVCRFWSHVACDCQPEFERHL